MKIATRDIPSFIKQPDKQVNAVLIYGPDSGMIFDNYKKIVSAILQNPDDPFLFSEIQSSSLKDEPFKLGEELRATSLIGGKRLIHLRDASDSHSKIIAENIPALSQDVYLVVTSSDLSNKSSLRSLFEKESAMAALPCYQDDERSLATLISSFFASNQYKIDRDAVVYLSANLGDNRMQTMSELEKILTYSIKNKHVTLQDAIDCVGSTGDAELSELTDAIFLGEFEKFDKTLTAVFAENASSISIIRYINNQLMRLLNFRCEVEAGKSIDDVIASARPPIFFKQVPIVKRQIARTNTDKLMRALKILIDAEYKIKLESAGNGLCRNYLGMLARL